MDQRKLFRNGRDKFQEVQSVAKGLGPVFNDVSCVACHFDPAVGGSSAILETRFASFVNGVYSDLPGGSLFQSQAIRPDCAEVIPPEANVIAKRQTTPLFGLGLVEAIPDAQIEAYAALQARRHPGQAGRVNRFVDVTSSASGVGRFGWKAQHVTLLAFSGDAYVNENGITNALFPMENAPNGDLKKLAACDAVKDPEDDDDDITAFANFMRLLAPPPRDYEWARDGDDDWARAWDGDGDRDSGGGGSRLQHGRRLFKQVGCAVCHHSGFRAQSPIRAIDGQRVDAFSDFLLHDIGTGDGIVQGNATGAEFRTPPLWGISDSAPYLHNGSAPTIRDAIQSHGNQGAAARKAFNDLSASDQEALLAFLDSI
jgi:CxxC motif-containing protein (DUF1111 family)